MAVGFRISRVPHCAKPTYVRERERGRDKQRGGQRKREGERERENEEGRQTNKEGERGSHKEFGPTLARWRNLATGFRAPQTKSKEREREMGSERGK